MSVFLTFRFRHCWEWSYHHHRPPRKKLWRCLRPVFFSGSSHQGSAERQRRDGTQVGRLQWDLHSSHHPTSSYWTHLCVWLTGCRLLFADTLRCSPAEVTKSTAGGRGVQGLPRAAISWPPGGRPRRAAPQAVRSFQRASRQTFSFYIICKRELYLFHISLVQAVVINSNNNNDSNIWEAIFVKTLEIIDLLKYK